MATTDATTRALLEAQWLAWAQIAVLAGQPEQAALDLGHGAAALATYDLGGAA